MLGNPTIFSLAIVEKEKERYYREDVSKRLEIFNSSRLREIYLELGDGLSILLYFSQPSIYYEQNRGIMYIECYPDDLMKEFEKISLDSSMRELEEVLVGIDGFFTGFIVDKSRIIFFRDHVGAIPCNYRISDGSFMAASFKKIMNGGVGLPPGRILVWDKGSLKIHRWFRWKQLDGDRVQELKNRLVDVFSRYLPEYFSLSFSGGIDSTIIAFVGSLLNRSFECVTVGTENSIDFQWAEEAASILGLRLRKVKVSMDLVKNVVEVVSRYLVNPTSMDKCIASVYYLVATNSIDDFIVSGQGADELFGGYYKYIKLRREKNLKYVHGVMMSDLLRLHETNIERDYLIVTVAGRRLIQPFLAKQIFEIALSTPVELKIDLEDDVRKIMLRKVGEMLGIPKELIMKPKKALQYSSGIQKLVSSMIKKPSYI
ncbi:MAG: asparagine synthase-related protein [Nitrososphaerota archaeon]